MAGKAARLKTAARIGRGMVASPWRIVEATLSRGVARVKRPRGDLWGGSAHRDGVVAPLRGLWHIWLRLDVAWADVA